MLDTVIIIANSITILTITVRSIIIILIILISTTTTISAFCQQMVLLLVYNGFPSHGEGEFQMRGYF
jgi:hypothetical protein